MAAAGHSYDYDIVIGLEVHVQLSCATKMFCRCATTFQASANTVTCPVCLGLPGALPTLNDYAVDQGIRAGLALGGVIAESVTFHRKNYFYPDQPKGYQITQFDAPLVSGGTVACRLALECPDREWVGRGEFSVSLERAHLEEDTAKTFHQDDHSLIDFKVPQYLV